MDGQGNLERTWKVREKSGNLIINGCGSVKKQTNKKPIYIYILFTGERMYFIMR